MWISLKHMSTLFNWNIEQRYTSSYLTCIWNLKFLKLVHFGLHNMYNSRSESVHIKHWRGPRLWHACCRRYKIVCRVRIGCSSVPGVVISLWLVSCHSALHDVQNLWLSFLLHSHNHIDFSDVPIMFLRNLICLPFSVSYTEYKHHKMQEHYQPSMSRICRLHDETRNHLTEMSAWEQGIDGRMIILLKCKVTCKNADGFRVLDLCWSVEYHCVIDSVLFFRCVGSIFANKTSLHGNICQIPAARMDKLGLWSSEVAASLSVCKQRSWDLKPSWKLCK
jgi:fumarate reductase subunit C